MTASQVNSQYVSRLGTLPRLPYRVRIVKWRTLRGQEYRHTLGQYPLSPLLRPRPPPVRSRLHRSGRSTLSRTSKAYRLTSASQHSLIDVNELVRDVLRQTSEIEERRTRSANVWRRSVNVSRPQRS